MRASTQHQVDGSEAEVGSNSDVAVYQELGTATIPARPFLSGAASHKAKEVAHVIGKHVAGVLLGETLIGRILPK